MSESVRNFSFVAPPRLPSVASLSVDRRLAQVDIAGCLAHAAALREAEIVTDAEATVISSALRTCLAEIEAGTFPWDESLEDVHTNIEARVVALAGAAGAKLHAGRSRNDQVALDERLYLRLELEVLLGRIHALEAALLDRAKETKELVVPGYTHLQRAQPVVMAHLVLAHFWRLERDVERLCDAFPRANVSPAGAAALAGTSLPIDPNLIAKLLGFDRIFSNSVDATSDRDYFVETVAGLALLAVHLSGLCEDLILWSTDEFGLVSLAEAHTAGSSYLPNKRNPDVLEMVRGQAGSIIGDLVALFSMLKGLPSGYHRDLQADKVSAFHAIDTISTALDGLADVVAQLSFSPPAKPVSGTASAALLVEFLVAKGVPYREAYGLVKGHVSALAEAADEATRLAILQEIWPLFDESALPLLTPEGAAAAVVSAGGTGPPQILVQLHEGEAALGRQAFHMNLIAKKNRRIREILWGNAPFDSGAPTPVEPPTPGPGRL